VSKKTDPQKRIAKLERIAADKGRPKKERKAARAEADALKGVFVPTPAAGIIEEQPSSPSIDAAARTSSPDGSAPDEVPFWRERQDAEVARQWAHHTAAMTNAAEQVKAAERHATGLLTWRRRPSRRTTIWSRSRCQEATVVETDHGRDRRRSRRRRSWRRTTAGRSASTIAE
jgi:hypothetical protein